MPKIKTFNPGAQPRGLPTPFGQGEQSGLQGLGQTIAGAGQQVGRALEAGERRRAQEQAGMNAARVSAGSGSFFVNATRLFEDDQTGYLRTKGLQALEERDETLKKLVALGQEEIDAVDDPKVKDLVRERIKKASIEFERRLFDHASRQGNAAADRSFQSDTEGWLKTATETTDPEIRDDAVHEIGFIAMARMAKDGGREKDIIEAGDDARGAVHQSIIVNMAEDDPAAASSYLGREDVAETLDLTFIEDQTKVIEGALRKKTGEFESANIAIIATNDRGYIDPQAAEDAYNSYLSDAKPDDETAEEVKNQLSDRLDTDAKRLSTNIYQSFGRGGMAVQNAIEQGKRDPIGAVSKQDRQFLLNAGAGGVTAWMRLKAMARARKANAASRSGRGSRSGSGKGRSQALAAGQARQQLNRFLPQIQKGIWVKEKKPDGTEAAIFLKGLEYIDYRWGPLITKGDQTKLNNYYNDQTSGQIGKDTSGKVHKQWEDKAEELGLVGTGDKGEYTPDEILRSEQARLAIEKAHEAIRAGEKAPTEEQNQNIIRDEMLRYPIPEEEGLAAAAGRAASAIEIAVTGESLATSTPGFDLIPPADVARLRAEGEAAAPGIEVTDADVMAAYRLEIKNGI